MASRSWKGVATSSSSPSEAGRAPLLELSGVTIAYDRVTVVKGVSFAVGRRGLTVFATPPGGGRSSVVLAVAGIVRPREGTITFDGRSLLGLGPDRVARRGLSHPESRRIFPEATVEENLRRAAAQRPPGSSAGGHGVVGDLERWLAAFPRLAAKRRALARALDPGAQAQLALARGLMAQPRLLLLDDPFSGQSAEDVAATIAVLRAARDEGLPVLYTDTWPLTVTGFADRVLRLEGSRVSG
jgi:branched-chain amino acid transport system ATP-binding protein